MNASANDAIPSNVPSDRVVDFDIYNPPNLEQGFHAAWQALHGSGVADLVWTTRNGGHWIATRGELIRDVFGDYKRFSSRVILVPKAVGEQHQMIPTTVDPPQHHRYRTLLNDGLAPRTVGRLEAEVRRTAVELIEAFRADGHCNFTTAYADHFPIRIFMSLVDLPAADAVKLKHWSDQLIRPDGSMTFEEAKERIYEYLRPVVAARLGGSGTDMITQMINRQIEGRALTSAEMLDLTAQVMIAGLDTVVNFLGFAFLFLAQNPEHRRALAANPQQESAAAVDELLRRFPVVTVAREVRHDMEIDGVQVKQGDMIVVPTPLVGTDSRMNERPLEVNFQRQGAQHATFGNGRHLCPGSHLARLELRVTLEEWFSRIPEFTLAPGAKITFHSGIVGVVDALPLVWNVKR
jgi:cytochrome P450